MRALIESQFNCQVLQWAEASDDGQIFSAVRDGVLLVAESVALLVSALQDHSRRPLLLMAA